jgi:DNA-binding transcriptional LysR family regulator
MARAQFRYKQNRLQQLRGFCYTARHGSISKAAGLMFLSQPSVTLQIQALEREFGVALFERHGPRIKLTPDGEKLYELAWPLVEGMDSLEESFAELRGVPERGSIDVAAGGSTILYVLPNYVEEFIKAHPDVEVKLHNVTGHEGLELLHAGAVDFAVGPMIDIPPDIIFHPIISYDPVLITPLGHPLAQKQRVTLEEISQYPLILPPRNLSTWRVVEWAFAQHNLKYEVKMEVGGWEEIKKYVELGVGISIVMSICLTGKEKLQAIPVSEYFPQRTYGIVLKKGKSLSPQARRFVKIMDPTIKDL